MFTGPEVESTLAALDITHVIWLPDSGVGPWEEAFVDSKSLRLVRVCREGEAWGIAAGLWIGGRRPIVVIQSTGLFESGDSLRHFVYDMGLPLYALIGYRSYLIADSPDSAKRFAEPVLKAYAIDYEILRPDDGMAQLAEHYRRCQAASKAGAALVPEGRM
jgi:sulfopyruvate decarboxylase TPP-binding subunit